MPGTKITIAGETWELKPLAGRKSWSIVPKLTKLITEIVYAAARANIDLKGLIGEEGLNLDALRIENLKAFSYVSDRLLEDWNLVSQELIPALLCREPEFFEENGTLNEIFKALSTALNFHLEHIFGEDSWNAVKKSFAVEAEEGTTTDSEQSEA